MELKRELFYSNPFLRETEARVLKIRPAENSNWYVFDRTIFYPKGGGQSSDRGLVNGNEVEDVQKENEDIWHHIPAELEGVVKMQLDWTHRYENMRQHTGQHILSAVFLNKFGFETVSVHLGNEDTLIELAVPIVSDNQLNDAEAEANRVVAQALPVKQIFAGRAELSKFKIRRDIKVDDSLVRLIQIGDFDCTGCGGIHVLSTSEVGLIKITGSEIIRGNVRVQAKIGQPAIDYFNLLIQSVRETGRILSCATEQIAERVSFLLEEKKHLSRQINEISDAWLEELANKPDINGFIVVQKITMDQAKSLSEKIIIQSNQPCFLVFENENQTRFVLRSISGNTQTAKSFLQKFGPESGLRGGGSEEFVQGISKNRINDSAFIKEIKNQFETYFSS